MAIKTPPWAPKGTEPTAKGWVAPSGEVIKKQKFTAEQIAEWHGEEAMASAPAPKPKTKPKKQTLHEAPVVETVIDEATEEFHYGEDDGDDDLKDIG